jgi:hypothetical protein
MLQQQLPPIASSDNRCASNLVIQNELYEPFKDHSPLSIKQSDKKCGQFGTFLFEILGLPKPRPLSTDESNEWWIDSKFSCVSGILEML